MSFLLLPPLVHRLASFVISISSLGAGECCSEGDQIDNVALLRISSTQTSKSEKWESQSLREGSAEGQRVDETRWLNNEQIWMAQQAAIHEQWLAHQHDADEANGTGYVKWDGTNWEFGTGVVDLWNIHLTPAISREYDFRHHDEIWFHRARMYPGNLPSVEQYLSCWSTGFSTTFTPTMCCPGWKTDHVGVPRNCYGHAYRPGFCCPWGSRVLSTFFVNASSMDSDEVNDGWTPPRVDWEPVRGSVNGLASDRKELADALQSSASIWGGRPSQYNAWVGENTVDGLITTAWRSAVGNGDGGVKQWLVYSFETEVVRLYRIDIMNQIETGSSSPSKINHLAGVKKGLFQIPRCNFSAPRKDRDGNPGELWTALGNEWMTYDEGAMPFECKQPHSHTEGRCSTSVWYGRHMREVTAIRVWLEENFDTNTQPQMLVSDVEFFGTEVKRWQYGPGDLKQVPEKLMPQCLCRKRPTFIQDSSHAPSTTNPPRSFSGQNTVDERFGVGFHFWLSDRGMDSNQWLVYDFETEVPLRLVAIRAHTMPLAGDQTSVEWGQLYDEARAPHTVSLQVPHENICGGWQDVRGGTWQCPPLNWHNFYQCNYTFQGPVISRYYRLWFNDTAQASRPELFGHTRAQYIQISAVRFYTEVTEEDNSEECCQHHVENPFRQYKTNAFPPGLNQQVVHTAWGQ
eukprot:gnl/TRDRNA2_/TRDRNA2_37972_c0_seq1.p1 gnl/TRDRNA2_/TRDRNA2_37972_c0~~gnl/TRDRNA2_/TRDRNA2_37972_c0_seq1.p1  ORF type:complete len:686 (-),score=34.51 gnl/TRDRNA2_/TRDRNA2_37972_c0_seq1:110-2167(-)